VGVCGQVYVVQQQAERAEKYKVPVSSKFEVMRLAARSSRARPSFAPNEPNVELVGVCPVQARSIVHRTERLSTKEAVSPRALTGTGVDRLKPHRRHAFGGRFASRLVSCQPAGAMLAVAILAALQLGLRYAAVCVTVSTPGTWRLPAVGGQVTRRIRETSRDWPARAARPFVTAAADGDADLMTTISSEPFACTATFVNGAIDVQAGSGRQPAIASEHLARMSQGAPISGRRSWELPPPGAARPWAPVASRLSESPRRSVTRTEIVGALSGGPLAHLPSAKVIRAVRVGQKGLCRLVRLQERNGPGSPGPRTILQRSRLKTSNVRAALAGRSSSYGRR